MRRKAQCWSLAVSTFIVTALLIATAPVFAQAPSNLTVKSATNKQTALSWSGTGNAYNVQRAVLGGAFSTIANASATNYTDTTIDAYTTYQYQIVAASGSATPSNKVTVGPPPAGFSVAAPPPGLQDMVVGNYGYDMSLALDGNGDPAIAFMFNDPNSDSDPSDTQLLFRSWNRALNTWNAVVKIAIVGDSTTSFQPRTALAFDTSTNTFAIAAADNTVNEASTSIFTSADGFTFAKKTTITRPNGSGGPSMALANGNIYLAFNASYEGTFFVTGKLSAAATTWTTSQPAVADPTLMQGVETVPSVALDRNGNPGVVFWTYDTAAYNQILYYWRPLEKTLVKVTDTQGNQNDGVNQKLVYFGLNPRILFFAQRNDGDFGDTAHFVKSDDAGKTWGTPVLIPPDGTSSTDYPADIALDSKGDIALAIGRNSGSGDSVCGNPKVSLSTDGVHFKTCDVDNHVSGVTDQFGSYPASLQIAYGGNDRLYLLWWESGGSSVGTGILMYRQPPANATATPVINTDGTGVNNGGTNLPGGVVAGSWVAVKGANFSDSPLDWSNADFSNGLPTTLNGVQVLMNGAPSAVYYVSPGQINVQAPNSVAGASTVNVQVLRNGVPSNTVSLPGSSAAPGIFAYSLDLKTFYPAALFLDYVLVGDPAVAGNSVRKAKANDIIQLYVTGLNVSPAGVLISAPISVSPLPTVTIGTAQATVQFAGLVAPGEYQMNIVVPSGLVPTGQTSANPAIVVKMGGQSSQPGVVLPVTN